MVEVQRVCVAQERCREQGDQDVVEKIVAQVFEKMPADLVKMDHHKAMRANGPCLALQGALRHEAHGGGAAAAGDQHG